MSEWSGHSPGEHIQGRRHIHLKKVNMNNALIPVHSFTQEMCTELLPGAKKQSLKTQMVAAKQRPTF